VKDLIEFLCRHLGVTPVAVESMDVDRGEGWRIVVKDQDMGRLLGRGGSMVKSIRQLLNASATIKKTSVKLEIEEQA
jgi:predicted RNA-binding protein YlqC (UPF0109 family)